MKYIKLYEDLHIMPDGTIKEIYRQPHDVVFDIYHWLSKLEEIEPDFEPVITRTKKDLDRGKLDPHELVEANALFFSEEDILDYLLGAIIYHYNNRK